MGLTITIIIGIVLAAIFLKDLIKTLTALAIFSFIIYWSYHNIPEVQQFIDLLISQTSTWYNNTFGES